MSLPRKSFVELLQNASPEKLAIYKKTSQQALSRKDGSRVFNGFDVLDPQIMPEFYEDIRSTSENEAQVKNFIHKLANRICDDLLNSEGHLKKEIITTLEWKADDDTLTNKIPSLISSFINALVAQITDASPSFIKQNGLAYANFLMVIDKNIANCLVDVLNKRGLHHTAQTIKKESILIKLIRYSEEKPIASAAVVTAFGGVAGLAVYGLFMAAKQTVQAISASQTSGVKNIR